MDDYTVMNSGADGNGSEVNYIKKDSSSTKVEETKLMNPDEVLIHSAEKGKMDGVRQAVNNGANIHVRSHCNYTALMHAACLGDLEMMEFLLNHEANVSDEFEKYNVLMCLCDSSNADESVLFKCLNLLLDRGADPTATDTKNSSPLIKSVRNNKEHLTLRLLKAGCPINEPDIAGWTPIFYAVQNNNLSMTQLLIDCGAQVHLMDRSGQTPRIIAASSNCRDLIRMVTTKLEPEYSIKDVNIVSCKRQFIRSKYKSMLNEGPRIDQRLYGFHDDAINFLRGIGLDHVAGVVMAKEFHFADLLTWDDENWLEAGINLSYHLRKIKHFVRKYHQKEWGRGAISDITATCVSGKVDLFKVVQLLASFLRLAHINSATSLYFLQNYNKEPLPPESFQEIYQLFIMSGVIRKQIAVLKRLCHKHEAEGNVLPPDLITSQTLDIPKDSIVTLGNVTTLIICCLAIKWTLGRGNLFGSFNWFKTP